MWMESLIVFPIARAIVTSLIALGVNIVWEVREAQPKRRTRMERIVVLSSRSETGDRLIECVRKLFPECQIQKLPVAKGHRENLEVFPRTVRADWREGNGKDSDCG